MKKEEVLKIIDEVMNNREIDSIRNAILAIRDKVIEYDDPWDDWERRHVAKLELRGGAYNDVGLYCTTPYKPGMKYVYIDTCEKIDTGMYGSIRYDWT